MVDLNLKRNVPDRWYVAHCVMLLHEIRFSVIELVATDLNYGEMGLAYLRRVKAMGAKYAICWFGKEILLCNWISSIYGRIFLVSIVYRFNTLIKIYYRIIYVNEKY